MHRKHWYPRHGQKLWQPARRGKIEVFTHTQLAKLPSWFLRPLWSIIVATLITITGHRELLLRSFGILIAMLWCAVDLWVWLLEKKKDWTGRFIAGWAGTSGLLIVAMCVMGYWAIGELDDLRSDVWRNLAITYSAPPNNDPTLSVITVKNNSEHVISERRRVLCINHLSVAKNGAKIVNGVYEQVGPGLWTVTSSPPAVIPLPRQDAVPLLGGGDGESVSCLSAFGFQVGVACLDFTVVVQWYLRDVKGESQEKALRMVTYATGDGKYEWHEQPLTQGGSYCSRFIKVPVGG